LKDTLQAKSLNLFVIIIIIMIISMSNLKKLYVVKTKRSYAVMSVEGETIIVVECSNKEKCESMGIFNCPPFCDKICALKNYLKTGRCKKGFKIEVLK